MPQIQRFLTYLKEVGEMTVHLFAKGEEVTALFQAINWLVLLLAGAAILEPERINDVLRVVAVLWLLFLAFVYAPYRVWAKEEARAATAESQLKPGLKCTFDTKTDCQHKTKLKFRDPDTGRPLLSKRIRIFRLRVESIGVEILRDCAAHLRWLKRDGRILFDHDSLPLVFAPAEAANPSRKEIRHKNPEHVDLFAITEDNQVFIYPWGRAYPISIAPNTLFSGPGEYRFHIVVSAPSCPSEELDIVLKWTGDWETASAVSA